MDRLIYTTSFCYIYFLSIYICNICILIENCSQLNYHARYRKRCEKRKNWLVLGGTIHRFFDVDSSPAIADSKEESDSSNENIEFQFIQENKKGNI